MLEGLSAQESPERNSGQVPGKSGRERSLHGSKYHRLFILALHVIDDGELYIESDPVG